MKPTLQAAAPLVATMCAATACGQGISQHDPTLGLEGLGEAVAQAPYGARLNQVNYPFSKWTGQAADYAGTSSHVLHKRSPLPVERPERLKPLTVQIPPQKTGTGTADQGGQGDKGGQEGKKAERMAKAEALAIHKRSPFITTGKTQPPNRVLERRGDRSDGQVGKDGQGHEKPLRLAEADVLAHALYKRGDLIREQERPAGHQGEREVGNKESLGRSGPLNKRSPTPVKGGAEKAKPAPKELPGATDNWKQEVLSEEELRRRLELQRKYTPAPRGERPRGKAGETAFREKHGKTASKIADEEMREEFGLIGKGKRG